MSTPEKIKKASLPKGDAKKFLNQGHLHTTAISSNKHPNDENAMIREFDKMHIKEKEDADLIE